MSAVVDNAPRGSRALGRLPFAWPGILFFVGLLFALHAMVGVNNSVLQGNFLDTDVYTWLNRVEQLHEHGNWFDKRLPQINPPLGHLQHWSRPFDVVLYGGAALGAPFVGFRQALEYWAIWVSPLLHALTLIALLVAVRPVFPRPNEQLPMLAFLFVGQSALLVAFAVGRADHQSLLLLCSVLALGFALRMFADGPQRAWCYAAGAVCALGAWVSVEFMLIVGVAQIAGGLFWLREGAGYAEKMRQFSLALVVAGSLAVFGHNGIGGFTSLATDEISLLYWLLFVGAAAFWSAAATLSAAHGAMARWLESWGAKVLFAGAGCLAVGAGMLLVMGDTLTGPLGELDSLYERVRLAHLGELHPIVSLSALAGGDYFQLFNRAIPGLGLALPALGCLVAGGLGYWREQPSLVARAAVLNAVAICIFVPLACYQVRWLGYAALLIVPAATWGVLQFAWWISHCLGGRRVELTRLLVVAVFALGLNFFPSLAGEREGGTAIRTTQGSSLAGMAEYLVDADQFGHKPLKILAFVDYGPELVYRTQRHSVFAMPNHRPQPGFIASYEAMSAAFDSSARPIIRSLQADLLLVRDHPTETSFYANDQGLETFHARLLRGAAPDWLAEVPLPAELAQFRLYRVSFDA